ncbi:hypothetical protein MACH17_43420 [Phaeobacter inhibens]|uniref:hypothetical protein n=1 Tax=Phaeobacter inhibens TaxID=221822 RepID=UPI002773E156|nr:hypothetical protein [Phaeobacter inhibens]GLO72825.1 hypothetical protein MACH17_43420 [Phaeobacter inhibens]
MKNAIALLCLFLASAALSETRSVFLEDLDGARIKIADLHLEADGIYQVSMTEAPFSDHFLSMRPFKCLEGPAKHWCHVPYPYEIKRNVSRELTDLEYDFLFVWKGATDYGINMWNGVYYKFSDENGQWTGILHEMDMDALSAPPPAGELRPLSENDLHSSDPESHWLPRIVIERSAQKE